MICSIPVQGEDVCTSLTYQLLMTTYDSFGSGVVKHLLQGSKNQRLKNLTNKREKYMAETEKIFENIWI